MAREEEATEAGWRALLAPEWLLPLSVLLVGLLLHSMNVMLTATVLPSIVEDVGGAAMMSWPTTGFLASSIIAASGTGLITAAIGARRAFCAGAAIFLVGSLLCAYAPTMVHVVAGRFVQGAGGGVLSALSYVLVRSVFPERLWARCFAMLAAIWGISTLAGPLVGGVFAAQGNWRGAFFTVAALAVLTGAFALWALPRHEPDPKRAPLRVPAGRVALICLGIGAMSGAAVTGLLLLKAGLIVTAIAALIAMLRLDRAAAAPLLPSDAFSLHTITGTGLWLTLLLALAYSPLSVYGALFLQRLHGLDPLAAGYVVALASLFWTLAAVAAGSRAGGWPARLLVAGPLAMLVALLGIGGTMPAAPVAVIAVPITLLGIGIGSCWAFVAQRVMSGAKTGEEVIAASSVITVQQIGLAFGAAIAGLIANALGFAGEPDTDAVQRAAFWVPMSLAIAAVAACLAGVRLNRLTRRTG
jgi:MFS family permease